MKLDKLIAEQEIGIRETEVINSITLASHIGCQRSYRDMLRAMRDALPKFFGFEGLGLLLRDTKTNELFSMSEDSRVDNKAEEPGDEFRPGTIIMFPSSIGITGKVFKEGKVYYSNDASRDGKFSHDIDNLSPISEIYNFLIAPVYGFRDKDKSDKPIGIV